MWTGYFDDSGSHSDSRVVVVGGLIGRVAQWKGFEEEWNAKLGNPLPKASKPPLRKFGLADCNALKGEFIDYSEAEAAAITHDFRQILIAHKLIGFAAAIERSAWRDLVMSRTPPPFKGDLQECVCKCVEGVLSVARRSDDQLGAAVFDKGFWTPELTTIIRRTFDQFGEPSIICHPLSCDGVAAHRPAQATEQDRVDLIDTNDDYRPKLCRPCWKPSMMSASRDLAEPLIGPAPCPGPVPKPVTLLTAPSYCTQLQAGRKP